MPVLKTHKQETTVTAIIQTGSDRVCVLEVFVMRQQTVFGVFEALTPKNLMWRGSWIQTSYKQDVHLWINFIKYRNVFIFLGLKHVMQIQTYSSLVSSNFNEEHIKIRYDS